MPFRGVLKTLPSINDAKTGFFLRKPLTGQRSVKKLKEVCTKVPKFASATFARVRNAATSEQVSFQKFVLVFE